MSFRCLSLAAFFTLVAAPAPAQAQSMSVIGGNSFARACYTAATLATQLRNADRQDLQECDQALAYGRLSRKDLLATYVNRGIVHAAMEDYAKALKDYRAAIKLEPGSGEVYVNLGNLYFLGQQYAGAIKHYTTAIELTLRQDHVAHFNRGMAYENSNDLAKAATDYRRALELSPQWALPQQRLERLLSRTEEQKT